MSHGCATCCSEVLLLLSRVVQCRNHSGSRLLTPSASQHVSGFQHLVDLSKPFTLCHRKRMGTHSNHLSDLSVNTLVCTSLMSKFTCNFQFLEKKAGTVLLKLLSSMPQLFVRILCISKHLALRCYSRKFISHFTSIFTCKYYVPSMYDVIACVIGKEND